MEDLLGRKGEDMKTKSGKKYHSSNARPSSTAEAAGAVSTSTPANAVVAVPLEELTYDTQVSDTA